MVVSALGQPSRMRTIWRPALTEPQSVGEVPKGMEADVADDLVAARWPQPREACWSGVFVSGLLEDRMGPEPPPNDMRLTLDDRETVGKDCSTVTVPCHLEDPRSALNPLDSETFAETFATTQVVDELYDRGQEQCLLLRRQ